MYGFIHGGNSQANFYIRVDGYPERGYYGYSLRSAIKKYRECFGLKYKKINFIDCR